VAGYGNFGDLNLSAKHLKLNLYSLNAQVLNLLHVL